MSANLLAWWFKTSLSVQEVRSSIPEPVKLDAVSPKARQRRNVSLELCCPGAQPRNWAVTRFDVIHCEDDEYLIFTFILELFFNVFGQNMGMRE